jgi:hypothetical protein
MAKIKLEANPTFKAKVPVPVPGETPALVEFTFRHRTRDAVLKWLEESKDASDVETVKAVASAWELDDSFTDENIATLCNNYAGAGFAIVDTYLRELRGARSKN